MNDSFEDVLDSIDDGSFLDTEVSPEVSSILGRVKAIIFESESFYVLSFKKLGSDSSKVINSNWTVRGNLYGLIGVQAGIPIKLFGKISRHEKYGMQFAIKSWDLWYQDSQDLSYFLTTCVAGFEDKKFALDFADRFSHTGISKGPGADAWDRCLALRDMASLLYGVLPKNVLAQLFAHFGSDVVHVLKDDPYRMLEVPGATLDVADRLAVHLRIPGNDARRLGGQILSSLSKWCQNGHLYVRRGDIYDEIPERSKEDFEKAFCLLEARNSIKIVDDIGVYPTHLYNYESESAERLAVRLASPLNLDVDTTDFIWEYERQQQIQLSELQREAIFRLTTSRVFVLAGKPGTGKTTLLKAFVRLFLMAKLKVALMAPTGIAAKRLEVLTSYEAKTVHRALEYNGESWGRGSHDKLVVDAVILDEASMLDQELLYRLLVALPERTIVVLVGDNAQLPSVGPGSVLRELLSCPLVPSVQLTQIFRQSEKGDIVLNAHRIDRGESVLTQGVQSKSEFQFVSISDEDRIVELIVEMASKLKSKDANFQVLSPKYDGVVGIDALNKALRNRLNPPHNKPSFSLRKDLIVYLGDRVIVTKNNNKLGVYNGDVGKVISCEKGVLVRIHGISGNDQEVFFAKKLLSENPLLLAYAISVHRSQGSEYDTIIMPVVRSQGRMLQRNLLYTAVTRARKHVWLIGDPGAVQRAIDNDKVLLRNTKLGLQVQTFIESNKPTFSCIGIR